MRMIPYNRPNAVRYAHTWAYDRNPRYYSFDELGGDCTNFVSQCLFAGAGVMDYTPTFGWYYIDANRKAPAWTGVVYLFNYLTREHSAPGPAAESVSLSSLLPGDVVQLSFDGVSWAHTGIVVEADRALSPRGVLIAAHSEDADFRPLSDYSYETARFLHITGVYASL